MTKSRFHPSLPALAALAAIFAASLLLYTGLWMFYTGMQPAVELGFDADYQAAEHAYLTRTVAIDSPAEKAGLRAGDRIVAIDGRRIADEGFQNRIWLQHKPGDQIHLTVQGRRSTAPVVLGGAFRQRSGGDVLGRQLSVWFPVPFLAVGLAVLFLRLGDLDAWVLALMLGGVVVSRSLPKTLPQPAWWPLAMAYQAILVGMVGPLFYWLYACFPTRSPMDRRWPRLKWAFVGLGLMLGLGGIRAGGPRMPPPFTWWLDDQVSGQLGLVFEMACLTLGLASFAANFLGARDSEARRKIRVMFWGAVISIAPNLVKILIQNFTGVKLPAWLDNLVEDLLILAPLSIAYAVIVHRVLEIPVLLKRSARYLLVQRGFLTLLSLVSIGLTLLFALSFPRYLGAAAAANQQYSISLGAVFGTALLWSGSQVHKRVSGRIDRAFFRSAYDARMILEDLAASSRTATDRTELARMLELELSEALKPSFVSVQLQPCPTPTEKPPEYLVPIPGRDGRQLGVLMLGPRLSEEPYSGEDRRLLASIASQTATALENMRLAEEIAGRIESDRRVAREMEIAREVQSRLLPQAPPRLKTLDCAARCIQARAVGGDYYDFLDLGPGRAGLALADVSGKGVHAALLVGNLGAYVRSQSSVAPLDPVGMLQQVNRMLYRSTAPEHFATLFFGIYDDPARELQYVNCGHNPPVWLRGDGSVARLEATATVIGAFDGWQATAGRAQFEPGDLLVAFSDGVTEAPRGDEEFGERRLIDELLARNGDSADAIVSGILCSVQAFSDGAQADDLTLLVARVL